LIKRLVSFCKTHQLLFPKDIVFVAISGGIDSVALLDAFLALDDNLPLTVKAIHVNHGVRGSESERDEHFVRSFCARRGVELTVVHLQGFNTASNEAALREARYRAFDELLGQHPGAKLATAHTLNDNIETLLMRLAKGSSLKGLRGIPVKRGPYIRPFLFLRRAEIEEYVRHRQLTFVRDSSNASFKYLRNRIRHQLLPVFEDIFGSQFYEGIARSLEEINDFYALFEREFFRKTEATIERKGDRIEIDLKKYTALDKRYRFRLIDYCISAFYPLNYSFSKTYLQRIDRFFDKARVGAVLNVHRDILLVKDRQKVILAKQNPQQTETLFLYPETKIRFHAFEIEIKKVSFAQVHLTNNKNVEFICGDNVRFPLLVRSWRPADRFYPLGLGKSQKVKDFFVRQKIDILSKKQIPLICNGDEIVWIAGYRLDERYRVHKKCQHIYKIEIKT